MVESKYEITKDIYTRLVEDEGLRNKFGKQVAYSSPFKPKQYGYYGCRVTHNDSKYFLCWFHKGEKEK